MLIFSDELHEKELNNLFPDSITIILSTEDDENNQYSINSNINDYNKDKIVLIYGNIEERYINLIDFFSNRKEMMVIILCKYNNDIKPIYDDILRIYIGKFYNKSNIFDPKVIFYTNVEEFSSMIAYLSKLYFEKQITYHKTIINDARMTLIFVEGINTPPNYSIPFTSVLKAYSDIKLINPIDLEKVNTYNLFHLDTNYINKFSFSTFYDEEEYF